MCLEQWLEKLGIGASWFGALATLLGALATLCAVGVALFKEGLVRWMRKPKFDVRSEPHPPDWHIGLTQYYRPNTQILEAQDNCYYLRLWIYNRGKSPATNVQVFASKLWRRENGSEKYVKEDHFLPMNLTWAHTNKEIFRDRIAPKMGRHCDLGHIANPRLKPIHKETLPDLPEDKTVLCLSLEVTPFTRIDLLKPGNYKLELLIAGDNASPKKKVVKIMHSGNWFEKEEDMFRERIIKIE